MSYFKTHVLPHLTDTNEYMVHSVFHFITSTFIFRKIPNTPNLFLFLLLFICYDTATGSAISMISSLFNFVVGSIRVLLCSFFFIMFKRMMSQIFIKSKSFFAWFTLINIIANVNPKMFVQITFFWKTNKQNNQFCRMNSLVE